MSRAMSVSALAVVLLTSGCGWGEEPLPPRCSFDIEVVEVFNTYATSDIADLHIVHGDDARLVCEQAFPYDSVTPHDFGEDELGHRRLTVMRFADRLGTQTTVWVYGLPGVSGGSALLLETGQSYLIPNQGPEEYFLAEADVIPRELIPRR